MKIIYNNIIPIKGFKAITLWPFIFVRKEYAFNEIDLNHELIHGELLKELLLVFFYIIYLIEWIFKGYRNISFEKEAYENEDNLNYIEWVRKHYAMWRKNKLATFS